MYGLDDTKMGKVKKLVQDAAHKKPEDTLVVIRHGATALNSESHERIRGWKDVPLSDEGRADADKMGRELKKMKPKIDGIITSDLSRAHDTAKAVSKHTGAPILKVTKGLRPWNLGDFQGKDVKTTLPQMQDFIKNKPDEQVPGGESFNAFKRRFIKLVEAVQKKYPKHKMAIVTHHRGERLLQGWINEGQPKDPGKISPKVFMDKGIKPGSYTAHEIPPK